MISDGFRSFLGLVSTTFKIQMWKRNSWTTYRRYEKIKRPVFASHITIQNVTSISEELTLQEQLLKNSDIMGKRVVDYIQDVSSLLSQITAYTEKTSDYIFKLTVIFYLPKLYTVIRSAPHSVNQFINNKILSFFWYRNYWSWR